MDEKNKDALGGGAMGALIGGAVGGPPGAVAGGIAGAILGGHERKHNKALREAYYNLKEATEGRPTFHVDHIDPDGAEPGGTRGVVKAVSGAPDLVMYAPDSPYPNLIIEVETVEGIQNDAGHAIDQLNDFQTKGFRRVLVVPNSQKEEVYEWCEMREQDGSITSDVSISTPERIKGVL